LFDGVSVDAAGAYFIGVFSTSADWPIGRIRFILGPSLGPNYCFVGVER
jgi:hypothetical protein